MTDETFFPGLRIAGGVLAISDPVEVSRFGDGSVITSSLGAALWAGKVTLARGYAQTQAAFEAQISKYARPGMGFFAHDWRVNGPQSDPGGVLLGASTPVIHTLDADNRRLRVSGLPAGYVLRAGDLIGWQYGASPTRYAHHRIASDATASGAGLTPLFDVEPHIRPGAVTGAAVSLVRPVFRAVILPGVEPGAWSPGVVEGATLQFIQTLR